MLTCPICHDPLSLEARTYRCRRGHAFDRAREGYVDLLPVGHGRTGITGDTRDMARARQRFLAAGHFAPLARRLAERVGDAGGRTVVEAGCGVGHYIGAVVRALPGTHALGFDVSREALRLAARAHPGVTFAINDVRHRITLADGAADILLDVFAPRNPAEFARVLRPGGTLLVVVPGADHLAELRARIPMLGIEPDKVARTIEQLAPPFGEARAEPLSWRAPLEADAVADLVGMTPSAHHLEDFEAGGAEVTFSFHVLGFRRNG